MISNTDALKEAVMAAADAVGIDLTVDLGRVGHQIIGEGEVALGWFGTDLKVKLKVVDSLVDLSRQLAVIVFHLAGNLYSCVLSDREQQRITMFLLDGKKLGLTPNRRSEILPAYWDREKLYRELLIGVKSTYERAYYGDHWKLKGKGLQWINDYLAKKKQGRMAKT